MFGWWRTRDSAVSPAQDLPRDLGTSLARGLPLITADGVWLLENGTDFFGLEDGTGRFKLE